MADVRHERRSAPSRERNEVWERRDRGIRTPGDVHAATINRVSWGAIFAGGVVALGAQLLLTLLGIAIGLSTFEPLTEGAISQAVGIGAGIWWTVTALVSLFLGGWTAGRLSGMPLRQDAMMNGIIAWALVTLLSVVLVGTGTGVIIGGAFNDITNASAMSAWWAFIAMVAGVVAAAIGGMLGAPRDLPATYSEQRE